MTDGQPTRRSFLRASALTALGAGVLRPDMLQGGQDVPQIYSPIPLKPSVLAMTGISERTMREHFKLYTGYVSKANEILGALQGVDFSKANQTFSELRELKVEFSFALGGVKNHEIYFDILGGKGGQPTGPILSQIQKDFGSYEKWEKDFTSSGLAARGWVWLAYDQDRKMLFNFLGDSQNTFPVWNAAPIAALDTYEHAYYLDYATDRKSYIGAFMQNLDWPTVESRYARAAKS